MNIFNKAKLEFVCSIKNVYKQNVSIDYSYRKMMIMKKFYCIKCSKNRKLKNPKINIFNKTLDLSIIFDKCDSNDGKIFKEEEPFKILKFFD